MHFEILTKDCDIHSSGIGTVDVSSRKSVYATVIAFSINDFQFDVVVFIDDL